MSKIQRQDFAKPQWLRDVEKAAGIPLPQGEPGIRPGRGRMVVLAIDRSGSMEGEGIRQAANGALRFANDAIRSGYSVGVVLFGSNAEVAEAPTRDSAAIERRLAKLEVSGSTNMAAGIDVAASSLTTLGGVICIVTDGQPDNRQEARASAQRARRAGIEIMAVGTDDADWSFLSSIISRRDLGVSSKKESLSSAIAGMSKKLPQLPAPSDTKR